MTSRYWWILNVKSHSRGLKPYRIDANVPYFYDNFPRIMVFNCQNKMIPSLCGSFFCTHQLYSTVITILYSGFKCSIKLIILVVKVSLKWPCPKILAHTHTYRVPSKYLYLWWWIKTKCVITSKLLFLLLSDTTEHFLLTQTK